VVAIEIDNEWSHCAFSFQYDYKNNPLHPVSDTFKDRLGLQSDKIRSVVLFDENKKFHSFGFDAEEKYAELAEHTTWFFFKLFMMKLSGKDVSKVTYTY
jgi:hypothetical protein